MLFGSCDWLRNDDKNEDKICRPSTVIYVWMNSEASDKWPFLNKLILYSVVQSLCCLLAIETWCRIVVNSIRTWFYSEYRIWSNYDRVWDFDNFQRHVGVSTVFHSEFSPLRLHSQIHHRFFTVYLPFHQLQFINWHFFRYFVSLSIFTPELYKEK